MLGSSRLLLLPLAAVCALAPAGAAHAAKATFTGVFEAERSVDWDQPRVVTQINCRGENYHESKGGETVAMKSKPFTVTVETAGRNAFWTFGPKVRKDPDDYGIAANGPHKRWYDRKMGTTGGWCGGGTLQPNAEDDCGTRIPTYQVSFYARNGLMSWNANHASWMANEKLHFYKCQIVVPDGMYNSSFPKLEGKYRQSDVFNTRKRTLKIAASKSYGPTIQPVSSTVNRTMKGSVRWTLTLTRKRK